MHERPRQVQRGEMWRVERAIVLQLLRDDHAERWSLAELVEELSDRESEIVDEALVVMEREGVIDREGGWVSASRAARHLDELELIGI
jgi:predicted transcriptional regulator